MKQYMIFFPGEGIGHWAGGVGGGGGSIWCILGLATPCKTWGLGRMI